MSLKEPDQLTQFDANRDSLSLFFISLVRLYVLLNHAVLAFSLMRSQPIMIDMMAFEGQLGLGKGLSSIGYKRLYNDKRTIIASGLID